MVLSSLMSVLAVFSATTSAAARRADVVTDGADGEIVMARLEAIFREGVTALRVGRDADRDNGTVLVGGDDDAFHGAFGSRRDHAGQRRRRLVRKPDCRDRQHQSQRRYAEKIDDFIDRSLTMIWFYRMCGRSYAARFGSWPIPSSLQLVPDVPSKPDPGLARLRRMQPSTDTTQPTTSTSILPFQGEEAVCGLLPPRRTTSCQPFPVLAR